MAGTVIIANNVSGDRVRRVPWGTVDAFFGSIGHSEPEAGIATALLHE